jgi:hypothetical protein
MPQSLATLRFQSALLTRDRKEAAVDLKGEVTVPTPFPAAQNAFVIRIGDVSATLQPDASGLSITQDATLLVTNTSLAGNGIVTGGTVKFELTLKGEPWLKELQRLGAIKGVTVSPTCNVPVSLQVGQAQHSASVKLEAAPESP